MKGIGLKTPIHTEKGILDGQPLLPNLPLPKKPIIVSDSVEVGEVARPRAQTMLPSKPNAKSNLDAPKEEKVPQPTQEKSTQPSSSTSSSSSEDPPRMRSQSVAVSKLNKPPEVSLPSTSENLIIFSPSAPRKRSNSTSNPSVSTSHHSNPTFDPFSLQSTNPSSSSSSSHTTEKTSTNPFTSNSQSSQTNPFA